MNRDLIRRGDLSHTESSGRLPLTKVDPSVRRAQASPLSIWRGAQGCQPDIDCQRVSAAIALTVCPIQARSALARQAPRSGLGLKNFWKPGPYQMDSTGVVIKPLSARLRTSRRHRL